MINIEKVEISDSDVKRLWFFRTLIGWTGYYNDKLIYDRLIINEYDIREKLRHTYLHITCSEGYYFHIPKIKGQTIQYSSSSDDNYSNKNLNVRDNNPRDYYIELTDKLISMEKITEIYKKFILDVRSDSHDKVQKYGIIVILKYKNNGLLNNPNYVIEVDASIHKLAEYSLLFNAIDVTFWALVLFQVVKWIFVKNFDWNMIGYIEVAIIISYLYQLFYRTKYLGTTFINVLYFCAKNLYAAVFKKSKISCKNRFSLKAFESDIFQLYSDEK